MKASFVLTAALFFSFITPGAFGEDHHRSSAPEQYEITNGPVAELIADTKASVGWTTNIKGHMGLLLGTDASHLDIKSEAIERDHGHNHHVGLTDLKPDTQYFFQVVANDNVPLGEVGTFRTLRPGTSSVVSRIIVP